MIMTKDMTGVLTKDKNQKVANFFKKTGIFWVFIALCIILGIISPKFIAPGNLLNLIKQVSINGILAIGMTLVIISKGIDLSVGSTVALSGVCAAFFAIEGKPLPILIPLLIALAVGVMVGLINGIGIAYGNLPPFIMTLGMMIVARGAALLFTGGRPIFHLSKSFIDISNGITFIIPHLVYYFTLVIIISQFILSKTVFGKRIYAVGGNEEAVRLSGIDVKKLKVLVYMVCGLLAGFCGLLLTSRITSGNATVASGYELTAIAAAVIGGVSMTGGSGSIIGAIVGALIIGVIQNGLDILGVSPFYQQIMQGSIIIMAVFIDIKSKSKV
jgi:ribose/xylose/arabinose/galactoside ABC-type transport system permease subunit